MSTTTKVLILLAVAMLTSAASRADDGYEYVVSSVTITDLGTLSDGGYSAANDINDSGIVVGWADIVSSVRHAFYYSVGTGMLDIGGGSASVRSEARGINNSNVVVGWHN